MSNEKTPVWRGNYGVQIDPNLIPGLTGLWTTIAPLVESELCAAVSPTLFYER